MSPKQHSPFKPIKQKKYHVSNHPKTNVNRSAILMKQGLDLSDYRDNSAFRTRKSRALKKLHNSAAWSRYNAAERIEKERELINDLEAERQAKKEEHERQWIQKVENDEISEDEENVEYRTEDSSSEDHGEESVEDMDEVESWSGFSEDVDEDADVEEVAASPSLGTDIIDIKKKSATGWLKKMAKFEEAAIESDKKLQAFLEERKEKH